tara:strand:+ start:2290 stop:3084 length:795 start_codon:yes stop_codon:yes gene_type:complete
LTRTEEVFHVLFIFGAIMNKTKTIDSMVKISDDNCDFIEEDEDTEEVKSQEEPAPEPSAVPPQQEEQNKEQKKDLVSMLMGEQPESRILMLHAELDEERSMEIISTFIGLTELVKPKKGLKEGELPYDPITFYISTYGGSADEMFGIYDMMNIVKKKCIIKTVGMGKVMSAGTLLLAAGTKGHRKIGKNCRVMLHQVSAAAVGPLFNMTTELSAIQKLQDQYIEIMASCTNLSKRKLKSLLNERVNVYLTAEEAIEYGIADLIV